MQRNGLRKVMIALAVCAGTASSVYADRAVVPASARMISVPGSAMTIATWNERGTPMTAVSLNGGAFDAMQAADYRLKLTYYPFDPLKGTPAVPTALTAGAENELFLVQSWAAPIQPMQEAIQAAGGTIERYVADWTLVVRLTPEAKAAVQGLPFVRWVGAYHPAYRVDQDTFNALASVSDAPARYSIETMRSGPQQQQALKTMIEAMGGSVNVMTLDQYRMEATLTPAQLLAVVHRNEVNFIDPWRGPGGTDMDLIRQQGGAVPTLSTAPAPGPFTGQGVRGEVFDTEVFATHQQWAGQTPVYHGANGNAGTHGSSCYGINFATGTGNVLATGMCPNREQGVFCYYPNASSFGGATSRLVLNTQAVDPLGLIRVHYQTSSVGNAQITTYSTISAESDNYLFLVDLLSCQSQSNTGNMTSRPEAWAKNILSVGGMDPHETTSFLDDTFPGASFGPASDSRVKPDLCNAYWNIFTTTAGAASYTQFSGTSGATPITAGHFGLLHQMWHAGVFPGFGGAPGTTVFGDTPKSATSKALMINQAFQYNWLAGGANAQLTRARQGWGVPHLGNLYNIRNKMFIVNETDVLTALQTKTYTVVVPAGEPALKVTMVYKDPQGNPAVQAQHRINNVDLKVTSPSGTVYWGNNGMTGSLTTVAGGVANTKDTVENVFVQSPAAGSWTVEVIAAEVVADGNPATVGVNDVKYGLVVGGATEASCYADCNLSGSLTLADFGCFQSKYVLGDMYADCDASGTLSLADFGCFQGQYVLGCP